MNNTILKAYEAYCAAQRHPAQLDKAIISIRWLGNSLVSEFPDTLEEYQSLVADMAACHKTVVGDVSPDRSERLRTSGTTTGKARHYEFNPLFQLWVDTTWRQLMYPFGWRPIVRLFLEWKTWQGVKLRPNEFGVHQYEARCGILNAAKARDLTGMLNSLFEKYPALMLQSVPDAYLYLNEDKFWQDYVIANKHRLSFNSSWWEPFYKKKALREAGVWFGNMMMDWPSGVNFFTCREGRQHVLPVFADSPDGPVNLLNLAPNQLPNPTEIGGFVPKSVRRCPCGYNRLNFTHIPHPQTAIRTRDGEIVFDPMLAERLTGHYHIMQFIQSGNTIAVRYSADGPFTDQAMLTGYFEEKGFDVTFEQSAGEDIFGKRIVFFKPPRPDS